MMASQRVFDSATMITSIRSRLSLGYDIDETKVRESSTWPRRPLLFGMRKASRSDIDSKAATSPIQLRGPLWFDCDDAKSESRHFDWGDPHKSTRMKPKWESLRFDHCNLFDLAAAMLTFLFVRSNFSYLTVTMLSRRFSYSIAATSPIDCDNAESESLRFIYHNLSDSITTTSLIRPR